MAAISVSTFSGQTFHSLGPLTTTFTAPASCATATNNVLYEPNTRGLFYAPDCNVKTSTLGDCFPSGQQIDNQWDHPGTALSAVMGGQIYYFSPGIVCPSSWTTAGVATKDSAGLLTSNGVFTSTSASLYNDVFVDQYRPNILMEAMAPDQTAALCCPSGWNANGGYCTSTLSTFSALSTGCIFNIPDEDFTFLSTTLTVPGSTTATGAIFTLTNTEPASVQILTTFSPADIAHWAPVSELPMVTLLHRAIDLPETTSIMSTDGASETAATKSGTPESTATRNTDGPSEATTSAGTSGTCERLGLSFLVMVGMGLLS